jgi:hypothetical protein
MKRIDECVKVWERLGSSPVIFYENWDAGASIIFLWLRRRFFILVGFIVFLYRSLGIIIDILKPFGFGPIGPPFGRAG